MKMGINIRSKDGRVRELWRIRKWGEAAFLMTERKNNTED